jgi:phosphatidylglycerophosphatase A
LDEVIGYLITLLWIRGPSALTLVVGFALFRFFDVLKPGPVRRMEQIPGADGILLDDVVAGLMGLGVMVVLRLTVGEAGIWESGGMQ